MPRPSIFVETCSIADNLYAPLAGLFDRLFQAGDYVEKGQLAGYVRSLDRLDNAPIPLRFTANGYVLAHGNRGYVVRGDMLAMLVHEIDI